MATLSARADCSKQSSTYHPCLCLFRSEINKNKMLMTSLLINSLVSLSEQTFKAETPSQSQWPALKQIIIFLCYISLIAWLTKNRSHFFSPLKPVQKSQSLDTSAAEDLWLFMTMTWSDHINLLFFLALCQIPLAWSTQWVQVVQSRQEGFQFAAV